MSYYLKHSAKGTTWGDHKYIRKEGNRYIYPEDVKKSASNNTFTLGKDGQTVRLDSNGNPTNKGRVNNNSSYNSSSSSKNPYDDLSGKELVDQLRKDVESGKVSKEYAEAYLSNTFGEYQPISGKSLSSSESKDPYEDLSNSELKDKLQKDVESGKLPKEYASEYYWNKTGDGLYSDKSSSSESKDPYNSQYNKLMGMKILPESNYEKEKVITENIEKEFEPEEYKKGLKEVDTIELLYRLQRLTNLDNKQKNFKTKERGFKKIWQANNNIDAMKNVIYDELKEREERESKRKNILSSAKEAANKHRLQNKRSALLEQTKAAASKARTQREAEANRKAKMPTNAYAGYIKRKDDPANRYRLVPNKNEQHKNVVKRRVYGDKDIYPQNNRLNKDYMRAYNISGIQKYGNNSNPNVNYEYLDNRGKKLSIKRQKIRNRNKLK